MNRRASNSLEKDVFYACESKCFYCKKQLVFKNREFSLCGAWNFDHLIPVARGGATKFENGVAACISCNSKKSDMTHVEFIKNFGGMYNIEDQVRCHGFTM